MLAEEGSSRLGPKKIVPFLPTTWDSRSIKLSLIDSSTAMRGVVHTADSAWRALLNGVRRELEHPQEGLLSPTDGEHVQAVLSLKRSRPPSKCQQLRLLAAQLQREQDRGVRVGDEERMERIGANLVLASHSALRYGMSEAWRGQ
eukprot:7379609-Prymnesium_polylepis.2